MTNNTPLCLQKPVPTMNGYYSDISRQISATTTLYANDCINKLAGKVVVEYKPERTGTSAIKNNGKQPPRYPEQLSKPPLKKYQWGFEENYSLCAEITVG